MIENGPRKMAIEVKFRNRELLTLCFGKMIGGSKIGKSIISVEPGDLLLERKLFTCTIVMTRMTPRQNYYHGSLATLLIAPPRRITNFGSRPVSRFGNKKSLGLAAVKKTNRGCGRRCRRRDPLRDRHPAAGFCRLLGRLQGQHRHHLPGGPAFGDEHQGHARPVLRLALHAGQRGSPDQGAALRSCLWRCQRASDRNDRLLRRARRALSAGDRIGGSVPSPRVWFLPR